MKHAYTLQPGEKSTVLPHGVLMVLNKDREPKLVWPDGRTSKLSVSRAMLVLQHPDIFDDQLREGPKSKPTADGQ